MTKFKKNLRMIAASAVFALSAGAASNALATPSFTVDPNSIYGVSAGSSFTADFVNGGSSALVSFVSSGGGLYNYSSVGYITYGQFMNLSSPVPVGTTRLGLDYGLFATFTQSFTCSGALAVGVTCGVDTISLNLYADPWNNAGSLADVFTPAKIVAGVGVAPVVTMNGSGSGVDDLLASASIVYTGLAGIDSLGGAFENVTTDISLTPDGSAYFTSPVPFFNLAFSNFNNTSQGITCYPSCSGPSYVAIVNENGGTDFNRIPEPETLALMGLGLLGMGLSRRARKA